MKLDDNKINFKIVNNLIKKGYIEPLQFKDLPKI